MRLYHIIICIIISFVYCSQASAQDLLFSDNEKSGSTVKEVKVLGTLNDKIVTYVNSGERARLIWYNINMDRLGYSPLAFYTNDISEIDLSIVGDEVHVFFQVKKKKSLKLYATKIFDKEQSFTPVLLDSIAIKGVFDKTKFEVVHNEEGKKHFYGYVQNVTGKELLFINHTVVNSDFDILQKFEQELAAERRYELVEMNVDKAGQFYTLIGEYRTTKKVYEELSLLTRKVGEGTISNIAIDLKNYAYSGLKSSFDASENNLYYGGLFHKTSNAEPEGVIAIVYNKAQNEVTRQHVAPIVLQGNIGSNVLSKLVLRNIRIGADNGFEIIAEKSYIESRTVNNSVGFMSPMGGISPGGNRIEKVYYDQDIYVFNMKENGDLNWTQSIVKNQEARLDNGAYSSFALLEHPIGAVYLFNDMGRSSRIITSYVSNKGELSLRQLGGTSFDNNDNRQFVLRAAHQISKDVLITPAISKGELSFVKISF